MGSEGIQAAWCKRTVGGKPVRHGPYAEHPELDGEGEFEIVGTYRDGTLIDR